MCYCTVVNVGTSAVWRVPRGEKAVGDLRVATILAWHVGVQKTERMNVYNIDYTTICDVFLLKKRRLVTGEWRVGVQRVAVRNVLNIVRLG